MTEKELEDFKNMIDAINQTALDAEKDMENILMFNKLEK